MDLEIVRFVSSTVFLVLLLIKQHFDAAKLDRRYGESHEVFRTMPMVAESTVNCQSEILTQMRLLTHEIEQLSKSLERTAGALPDRRGSPT